MCPRQDSSTADLRGWLQSLPKILYHNMTGKIKVCSRCETEFAVEEYIYETASSDFIVDDYYECPGCEKRGAI